MAATMVLPLFASYYYKPDAQAYPDWEPQLHRLTVSQCPEGGVNLSEMVEEIEFQLPKKINSKLDQLITPAIYKKLTQETLSDEEIASLEFEGFIFIKKEERLIFYHQELPDYIIKIDVRETRSYPLEATAKQRKTDKVPIRNTNLLRPVGRRYLAEKLRTLPTKTRAFFEIPKEYYYASPHGNCADPIYKQYFCVSKRKEIYSSKECFEILHRAGEETQKKLAAIMVQFIKASAIHDWHGSNLTLKRDSTRFRFVLIDTELIGTKMDASDKKGAHLFRPAEQVLLGLIIFRDRCCIKKGLTAMADTVNDAIVDYLNSHPKIKYKIETYREIQLKTTLSKRLEVCAKIVLSILFPLIPLILMIFAIYKYHFPSKPHLWDKYDTVYGVI